MAAETATETAPQAEQASSTAPVAAPPPPKAPAKKGASDAKAKGSKGSEKASGKAKKSKGDQAAESDAPSVAAHPRAARAVARAKGWGGLIGFLLGGYLSLPTNTLAAAGLRALLAGIVCYVVVWAGAVFLWRRLVMLEINSRKHKLAGAHAAMVRRELPAGSAERPGAKAA